MAVTPNSYIMAGPKSLAARIIGRMRLKMYARFLKDSAITPQETLLDVGASAMKEYEAFNSIESWYPHKDRITAIGLEDASYLEKTCPGLTFLIADGLNMPFADSSYDIVYSSAVIEHVGSEENQKKLIAEMFRVARRGVFLTTPNRWHPVEFHTVLPLLHWLPKRVFRRILRGTRYDFYASEEHLNLLGKADIERILPQGCSYRISHVSFLGFPSNLLLWIDKTSSLPAHFTMAR